MKTTMMMIMSMVNYCGFPDSIFEVSKDIWQRQGTHFVVEPLKFQLSIKVEIGQTITW